MERELGTLADAAGEDPQPGQGQRPEGDLPGPARRDVGLQLARLAVAHLGDLAAVGARRDVELARVVAERAVDLIDVEGAQVRPEEAQAEEHPHVADPVDDERLVGRVGVLLVLVPEADQEVGADADELPEDEDHEDVGRRHQAEHREAEEREVREEPRIARIVVHVPHRVDVDQGRDERDHQEHDHGQVVDVDPERDRQVRSPGASDRRRPGASARRVRPSRSSRPRPAGRGVRPRPCRVRLAFALMGGGTGLGLGGGVAVVREDALRLGEVGDEADEAQQERQADRPGRHHRVEPAQEPAEAATRW